MLAEIDGGPATRNPMHELSQLNLADAPIRSASWRAEPARLLGRPVAALLPVQFRLD
jgi:hypothetical protein